MQPETEPASPIEPVVEPVVEPVIEEVEDARSRQTLEPIDFVDYLLERQVLDEEQLLDVLAEHWQHRTRLVDSIVRRGYLDEAQLTELFAEFENVHVVYV